MKKNIVEGLQIWLSKSTDVYFREKKKMKRDDGCIHTRLIDNQMALFHIISN